MPTGDGGKSLITLTEEWKTGLTGAAAAILFAIVYFHANRKRRVRLDEIVSALKKPLPDTVPQESSLPIGAGVRFTSATIAAVAPRLLHVRWRDETQPYVDSSNLGYKPVMEEGKPLTAFFITKPLTSKLLFSIYDTPQASVDRSDFIAWAKAAYKWDHRKEAPEDHIRFLVDHFYCDLDGPILSVTTGDDGRFTMERGYLELIRGPDGYERYQNLKTIIPAPQPVPGLSTHQSESQRHLSILTPEEVQILMALWKVQHFDSRRRGLTASEIVGVTGISEAKMSTLLDGLGMGPSSIDTEKDMVEAEETYRDPRRPVIYRLKFGVIGWPPAALTICDLIDHQDYPPRRNEYPHGLSSRLLHQDPSIIETECIAWPEHHRYIEPAPPPNSQKIRATRRSIVQRPYLEEVSGQFKEWLADHEEEGQRWEKLAAEWRRVQLTNQRLTTSARHEIALGNALTDQQGEIMYTLRNLQFQKGGLAVSPREITEKLKLERGEVLKEFQYLEEQWPWRLIEPDGLGDYRLAWPTDKEPEGAASYLDTAFMLVNFANIPKNAVTGRVGEEDIVKHLQQVTGIGDVVVRDAIRFCVGSHYLKRWESEDNLFLTDRVKYEWRYLERLAHQHSISAVV